MRVKLLDLVTLEQLLAQHRWHIDHVTRELARRYHLSALEADEFGALIERALERNDYEVLRDYDGRSSWETYLTTVITRLFFTFQSELWGQWRPTAIANRLGPTAVLMEELMLRDGMSFDDAIAIMRNTHRVDQPRHRLEALAGGLGLLSARNRTAEERSADAEIAAHHLAIERALRDALALLSPDERLMLAMRFVDRRPVTKISRLLKIDPRPLQRRIDQATEVVRMSLLTQGVAADDIQTVLSSPDERGSSSVQRKCWIAVSPHRSR